MSLTLLKFNILIKFLLKICAVLKFTAGKLGHYDIAQESSNVQRKVRLV